MKETKGVLKARVLALLEEKGPMTALELARELDADTRRLNGCLRALSYSGQVYPVSGRRKDGRVWAIRWIREKKEKDLET